MSGTVTVVDVLEDPAEKTEDIEDEEFDCGDERRPADTLRLPSDTGETRPGARASTWLRTFSEMSDCVGVCMFVSLKLQ